MGVRAAGAVWTRAYSRLLFFFCLALEISAFQRAHHQRFVHIIPGTSRRRRSTKRRCVRHRRLQDEISPHRISPHFFLFSFSKFLRLVSSCSSRWLPPAPPRLVLQFGRRSLWDTLWTRAIPTPTRVGIFLAVDTRIKQDSLVVYDLPRLGCPRARQSASPVWLFASTAYITGERQSTISRIRAMAACTKSVRNTKFSTSHRLRAQPTSHPQVAMG